MISIGQWIAAGVAVVGAGVTYSQQASAAKAQEKDRDAQKKAQEEYNKQLEKDAIRQYGELDKAEADAIHESHAQSMQSQRDFMTARSTVELQAAVSGTYGNSVNLAIQDLKTGLGGRMADITFQRDRELDDINRTADRIQASPALGADRTVSTPSYFKAFQAGVSTYQSVGGITGQVSNAYSQLKPATPGKLNHNISLPTRTGRNQ
jgi:hypothetical protein